MVSSAESERASIMSPPAFFNDRRIGSGTEGSQLLAKASQDTRLRDTDGTLAHRQLGSDVPGGTPFDGGAPERLPGPFLEFLMDRVEDAAEESAVPVFGGRDAPR